MKKIDTLVEDIYDVLATNKADDNVDVETLDLVYAGESTPTKVY